MPLAASAKEAERVTEMPDMVWSTNMVDVENCFNFFQNKIETILPKKEYHKQNGVQFHVHVPFSDQDGGGGGDADSFEPRNQHAD
jgi:hypothetical protein